jgi:FkbM family methyltransferase
MPAKMHGPAPAIGHAKTDTFFDCLMRLRFEPRTIVDVGANRGNWTRTALRYFPAARYTLFEPQDYLLKDSDIALDPRVKIFAMGAGPVTSTMKLSKHERDDSFSFALTEEEAASHGREQVEAPVVALDEFLPSQGITYPEMLKIDAEGWDLEVLKGAEKCVASAEVVLLEAAVMNKLFANRFETVAAEMSRRGFVVFDITDLNRTQRDRALWLVEIAFVKRGGTLDSAVDSFA